MNSVLLISILAGIVVVFLGQIRREMRRNRRQELPKLFQPEPKMIPAAVTPLPELPPLVALVAAEPEPAPAVVKKLKKRVATALTPSAAKKSIPAAQAVALLRQKNSLATAFVLSEIFAGPRSRRK